MARFVFLEFGTFTFVRCFKLGADRLVNVGEVDECGNLLEDLADCKDVWLKYREKVIKPDRPTSLAGTG